MELRSSRSRSATPLITADAAAAGEQNRHNRTIEKTILKSAVESAVVTSVTKKTVTVSSSSLEEKHSVKKVRLKARPSSPPVKETVSSSINSVQSYNNNSSSSKSSSSTLEASTPVRQNYQQQSASGQRTAYLLYKEAGEYWSKFPKTDYTYSWLSKDRREVSPGEILMPNMSRDSIHRNGSAKTSSSSYQTQTRHFSSLQMHDKGISALDGSRLESRRLFRNKAFDDADEEDFELKKLRRNYYQRQEEQLTIFRRTYIFLATLVYTAIRLVESIGMGVVRWYYKMVGKLLTYETEVLKKSSYGDNRLRRLFILLLIPLLFLLGYFLCCGVYEASSIVTAAVPAVTSRVSGLFTPRPLRNSELDLDALVGRILAHPAFQRDSKLVIEEQLKSSRGVEGLLASGALKALIAEEVRDKAHLSDEELARRFTDNPALGGFIEKKLDAFESRLGELEDLRALLEQLQHDLRLLSTRVSSDAFLSRNQVRTMILENLAPLRVQLRRCCRDQTAFLEEHVKKALADLLPGEGLEAWLRSMFVAKEDLEQRLANATEHFQAQLDDAVDSSAGKIMAEVSTRISQELEGGDVSDARIRKVVREVLAVYDADKTGLVDWAMESAGGQVLSTRCTENYLSQTAVFSVFGISLWYKSNTPRYAITPGTTPGECWSFVLPGYLVVQLSGRIRISAFSVEHIPKSLSPKGDIDSAPKDFAVYGLAAENDQQPFALGQYRFDDDGPSLQYFAAENVGVFEMIELRITSNYGNPNFTCLYRFRVHGSLV